MAQAILADTFPPQQRGLAFALYGITAIMAPTIGPTLGGWITFNYSWRWIFFINLPVGMLTWFLVRRFVEDPPYLAKAKGAGVKLDYIGIAFLHLGHRSLADSARQGPGRRLVRLAIHHDAGQSSPPCRLISLVIWEWFQKAPIIDVRMFKSFQFCQRQPDDVHAGNHVVQQPGADAAVSADAGGLHLATGGTGSFRRAAWSCCLRCPSWAS